jgi:hypothetical protein
MATRPDPTDPTAGDPDARDAGARDRDPDALDPDSEDAEEVDAPVWVKLILTAVPFLILFSLLFLDRCTRG